MKRVWIGIHDAADHAEAWKLIGKLMRSDEPGDRARSVPQARLVEAYDRPQWPRTAPAVPIPRAHRLDQHALSRVDLVALLGTASRVSERLSGKRDWRMSMVHPLRARFHNSADFLVSRRRARSRMAAQPCITLIPSSHAEPRNSLAA